MLFLDDVLKISHVEAINIEQLKRAMFIGVSTDSRKIFEEEIFVALRGEKFDGHSFVEQVFQKGIVLAVVEKSWYEKISSQKPVDSSKSFIIVEDTSKAYGELANIWRKKFDIPIIAITGSNGKTTTKEMLKEVLQTQHNVHFTKANDNNQIGVPKTLLGLNKHHEIVVLELGSNHSGEIEYLKNIAQPTHSLVTNIGREHLEFFGSLENVAKEETTDRKSTRLNSSHRT